MDSTTKPILLVGCGNMGGAMLRGWLAGGTARDAIIVQEPTPSEATAKLLSETGIRHIKTAKELDPAIPPALALMAVKPQVMDDVFAGLAPRLSEETIVLSIAAGRTIESFARLAKPATPIVRTIPNTPSAIGRGITVCTGNAHVGAGHRELCDKLLSALGEVAWVDEEKLIDAATAVSGSGPAYVFYLAECLAAAAREVGLSDDLATQLSVATVSGAGELLRQSHQPAETLRRNVTSPNGTTQAALDVLMADDGLHDLMIRAVEAARKRSAELSA